MSNSLYKLVCVAHLAVMVPLGGCHAYRDSQLEGYRATVLSAREQIPAALEMEMLFGDADHFITHYQIGDARQPKIWNTEVFIRGRYVLTMQVSVTVDHGSNKIDAISGPPIFYLTEYYKIDILRDGRCSARCRDIRKFDLSDWSTLQESSGDWESIGCELRDQPTEGFEEFVRQTRRDWPSPLKLSQAL